MEINGLHLNFLLFNVYYLAYELNVLTYKISLTFFMVKEGKSDTCSCDLTLYHWFINLCIKCLENTYFLLARKQIPGLFTYFPSVVFSECT